MFRITQATSAAASTAYHMNGMETRAAYYTKTGPAVWKGRAAERLGLARMPVTRRDFGCLSDGYDPRTGDKLYQRRRAGRRPGYDVTADPPKSVTLAYIHTGDERLREALREAAFETLERDIEPNVATRDYDSEGRRTAPLTSNMIYSGWDDYDTRPTLEDGKPDPQLHMHFFCMMNTYHEGRWVAADYSGIKSDGFYYEAVYHARLAKKLVDLGYAITPVEGGKYFELTGVSRRLIEKFSRRTQEIEAAAVKLGIADPRQKGALGAKTRQGKIEISHEALIAHWLSRLTPEDIAELGNAGKDDQGGDIITPEQALQFALDKLLERASVAREKNLLTEALRFGIGHITPEDLMKVLAQFKEDGRIIAREIYGRVYLTTPAVVAEETAMLDAVRTSAGTCPPLKATPHVFEEGINESGSRFELSEEQKEVVCRLLSSQDRIVSLRGVAGAGKTTALRELVAAIVSGETPVYTLAPSAEAVDILRAESFERATTLQSLLARTDKQAETAGSVLLVDEAGLISVRQMRALFDLAEKNDARVILVGNEYQHTSVERSDVNVLRILRRYAGLDTAAVTQIRRQKGRVYRDAVETLSRGQVVAGYKKLEAMGAVQEIEDDHARYKQIASDYLRITTQKKRAGWRRIPKSALIISPTHGEGHRVTAAIRLKLREAGRIGQEDHTVLRLRPLGWTHAERAQARFYEEGMVIQFTSKATGFKAGARLTVTGYDQAGQVIAVTDKGKMLVLPLDRAARFQVYHPETLALATGDMMRITQNGQGRQGHSLTNGMRYRVAGFTSRGDIRLDNGSVISRDYGHLDHGYCLTSHAAQGKTVDHVLIAESAVSFGAASAEQLYVSASRGREGLTIYTDSASELGEALARARLGMAASDFLSEEDFFVTDEEIEHVRRLQKFDPTLDAIRRRREQEQQEAVNAARDGIGTRLKQALRAIWRRIAYPPPPASPSDWEPAL